jgi:LemA protein
MKLDMGKVLKIVVVIAVLSIVVFAIWMVGVYNGFVKQEEQIDSQWAQVTNEYQRKIDLIPALVETVDDYQEFENSTLSNITALRTRWMEASNAGNTEAQVNATNALDAVLRSIILTYESYPYLQSIEAVSSLMYSLEGTENRITVERMRYNEDVRDFNGDVRSFPRSMVANWYDFDKRSYYKSDQGPDQP